MRNHLGIWASLVCTLPLFTTASNARDFFEVMTLTPSRIIRHEVDLKGQFDTDVIQTHLIGPRMFSHAVAAKTRSEQETEAYLNWYKIEKPTAGKRRMHLVSDAFNASRPQKITIEKPAFFLTPAQRITTGEPAPIPAGLDMYKAYQVVTGQTAKTTVELTGTFGTQKPTLIKPVFLCLPVEEWHHDEHFAVKNPCDCLLVYETQPDKISVNATTIDQFGLNRLKLHSSKWICVPARIAEPSVTK